MRRLLRIRRGRTDAPKITKEELAENVIVTAMGPIGHIYFPVPLPQKARAAFGEHLVNKGSVPLVVYRSDAGEVFARNARGLWKLPEDIQQVCGPHHRFAHEVQNDLMALTENPNAGDVIIGGWNPEQTPLTFVQERGAHGSIGIQETRGFALLPSILSARPRETSAGERYIRGVDLHHAARQFLNTGKDAKDNRVRVLSRPERRLSADTNIDRSHAADSVRLRVMTYNAHRCIGMDGKCRPQRIADIIALCGADVIALQEMDENRRRTGNQNQTALIASQLGMYHRFFPVWSSDDEKYGLSIIGRFPISVVRQAVLTDADRRTRREARGAIWVSFTTDAGPVHFVNTHLGLTARERSRQLEELLSNRWLDDLPNREPVIIAGDLNAGPKSPLMERLTRTFHCVQSEAENHLPQKTFASVLPLRRIDHILTSRHFQVAGATVPRNHFTAVASDHLPVCADLILAATAANSSLPAGSLDDMSDSELLEQVVSNGIQ
jgi:endonuclease/exonuclease/phosphatase family metal-dependent hydrolase